MAGVEPANANPDRVADESRLERRLDRAVARATTPRGAAIVIATASTVMTVVAGLLVTVVDRETYPSIGSGLWWAAQTVTTVGYGDNVPMNLAGQLVAGARHAFGDRLPDNHHRLDHEHLRVALTA
jgi:Ion channel